jgi:hypothetical protein
VNFEPSTDRPVIPPSREVADLILEAERVCREAWLDWFFEREMEAGDD